MTKKRGKSKADHDNAPPKTKPFDMSSVGISTDLVAALNLQELAKDFDFRKPNDQEFSRTSPLPEHFFQALVLRDKQAHGLDYVIAAAVQEQVRSEFPRLVKRMTLAVAQTLAGARLLVAIPLGEDKVGRWSSSLRAGYDQAKTKWTRLEANGNHYDVHTVDNPREIDWKTLPPMAEILGQALNGRIIDSLDHPLFEKLRGKIAE